MVRFLILVLAVTVLGTGTAFAQTPPATTDAAPDESAGDGTTTGEAPEPAEAPKPAPPEPVYKPPKVEKPADVETPPKPEKPPKLETPPKAEAPPTTEAPKPTPPGVRPKLKAATEAKPQPTQAGPKLGWSGRRPHRSTRAESDERGGPPSDREFERRSDVGHIVSPATKRVLSTAGGATLEPTLTGAARSGSDRGDATSSAGQGAVSAPGRAIRLADQHFTAPPVPADRREAAVVTLTAPAGYDVTLLLIGFLLGGLYAAGLRAALAAGIWRRGPPLPWRRRQPRTAALVTRQRARASPRR